MWLAYGSTVALGQKRCHSSYVRRPSRIVSSAAIWADRSASMSASKYSDCHVSGDSVTPSSEMNKPATIFLIAVFLRLLSWQGTSFPPYTAGKVLLSDRSPEWGRTDRLL